MLPCIEVVVVRNVGRRDSYEERGPLKESHGSVRFVIRVLAIGSGAIAYSPVGA